MAIKGMGDKPKRLEQVEETGTSSSNPEGITPDHTTTEGARPPQSKLFDAFLRKHGTAIFGTNSGETTTHEQQDLPDNEHLESPHHQPREGLNPSQRKDNWYRAGRAFTKLSRDIDRQLPSILEHETPTESFNFIQTFRTLAEKSLIRPKTYSPNLEAIKGQYSESTPGSHEISTSAGEHESITSRTNAESSRTADRQSDNDAAHSEEAPHDANQTPSKKRSYFPRLFGLTTAVLETKRSAIDYPSIRSKLEKLPDKGFGNDDESRDQLLDMFDKAKKGALQKAWSGFGWSAVTLGFEGSFSRNREYSAHVNHLWIESVGRKADQREQQHNPFHDSNALPSS